MPLSLEQYLTNSSSKQEIINKLQDALENIEKKLEDKDFLINSPRGEEIYNKFNLYMEQESNGKRSPNLNNLKAKLTELQQTPTIQELNDELNKLAETVTSLSDIHIDTQNGSKVNFSLPKLKHEKLESVGQDRPMRQIQSNLLTQSKCYDKTTQRILNDLIYNNILKNIKNCQNIANISSEEILAGINLRHTSHIMQSLNKMLNRNVELLTTDNIFSQTEQKLLMKTLPNLERDYDHLICNQSQDPTLTEYLKTNKLSFKEKQDLIQNLFSQLEQKHFNTGAILENLTCDQILYNKEKDSFLLRSVSYRRATAAEKPFKIMKVQNISYLDTRSDSSKKEKLDTNCKKVLIDSINKNFFGINPFSRYIKVDKNATTIQLNTLEIKEKFMLKLVNNTISFIKNIFNPTNKSLITKENTISPPTPPITPTTPNNDNRALECAIRNISQGPVILPKQQPINDKQPINNEQQNNNRQQNINKQP